eukprot:Nk52_evm21s293 gene=Nk52_evmTU21s293
MSFLGRKISVLHLGRCIPRRLHNSGNMLDRSGGYKSVRAFSTTLCVRSDTARTGFVECIGETPLMLLPTISKSVGFNVYVKCEHMNPGGSVKDRAAMGLIQDAEERNLLKPRTGTEGAVGTVVEGTAGNTGIGLAHVCNSKGYKCVIYMPDTQSEEKINTLKSLGADVRPVPAVPFTNENNYNHQAKRYADELNKKGEPALWTNQFDNTANAKAHLATTGPEIYRQLGGNISGFTCATGTGGTLAGVGKYLKGKCGDSIKIGLTDPHGSVLYNYITSGCTELTRLGDGSITEGIGQGRVTDNLKFGIEHVDCALSVSDAEAVEWTYRLLFEEGLFVGASSGLNVCGAIKLGQKILHERGESAASSNEMADINVVTIVCDSGARYANRLYSQKWLESKKLFDAIPPPYRRAAAL